MTIQRLLIAAAAAAACLTPLSDARAADHLDAPMVQADGRTDINDLYAFQSPSNPNNTVLIMTVNPGAGPISPREFSTTAEYTFNIDNDGDAVADLAYTTTFAGSGGSQTFEVISGGGSYATGSFGQTSTTSGGAMVTVGNFDDPFFFDLNGFNDGFNFTGDDFFAGLDVSAIVLEVPSSELGGPNIGVWATTFDGSQIDRMGRPAITTALVPSGRKDEFNQASPAGDLATFGDDINASIASLSSQMNADALTPVLLPDVLTIDVSDASGFLNGRGLADDVIDAELNLLSEGAVTTDGVGTNDAPFLSVFPYLAPANIPEPTTAALLLASLAGAVGLRSRR